MTLADVRADRSRFPADRLAGCETALILFGAAFSGRNDAIWIRDAGITATVVDTDAEKLAEMEAVYPDDWEFIVCDAFYLELRASLTGRKWDVVSVDPWSNEMQRCADYLPFWCALANVAVMLGTQAHTSVEPPEGWAIAETLHRSDHAGGVYWTICERA